MTILDVCLDPMVLEATHLNQARPSVRLVHHQRHRPDSCHVPIRLPCICLVTHPTPSTNDWSMSEQNRPPPHRTTLSDVRDLAVVPIYSPTEPNAAGLLGVSRWTAYNLASAGTLETIRLSENRLLVPVHSLLRLVGETGR